MSEPSIIAAGKGTIVAARGSVMAFKAIAAQTDGDFSLPHRHVNCSEAFWVLDGTITFVLDGVEQQGRRDDFLLVPRGAGHTFGNDGDEPARLLVLHAPAMDAYFAELDALWSRATPPAPEEERALMSRYGMEPA
jgi:mannose-6-phosphate isomerase-like protein (cupin superfamily)